MAQKRSKASRFKSPSTGEYCTTAQYIAEILVQRKAEKDNKGSLAYKFWSKTQKAQYTRQVQRCNKLIAEFGEKRVYDYVINKNKRVYSVLPNWVKEEISNHNVKEQSVVKTKLNIKKLDPNAKPRKPFGSKTLFSKLRNEDAKSQER